MDENRSLELIGANDYEIAAIKGGYERFIDGKGPRYFGAVLNKKDLSILNRAFHYVDTHSLIIGAVVGAATAVGCYETYKHLKKKKAEVKEEY